MTQIEQRTESSSVQYTIPENCESDPQFLIQTAQKYNFSEYLTFTAQERQTWRFQNLARFTFDELLAFYEYCIEPEEIKSGKVFSLEIDLKEVEKRVKEQKEANQKQAQILNQLKSENIKRAERLEKMKVDQADREQQWKEEDEEDDRRIKEIEEKNNIDIGKQNIVDNEQVQ